MRMLLVIVANFAIFSHSVESHVWQESPKMMMEERLHFRPNVQPPPSAAVGKLVDNDIRLPTHLKPTVQTVSLQPFIVEGNFTTRGFTEIYFDCINATTYIKIHMADIITFNQTITLEDVQNPSQKLGFVGHEYYPDVEMYVATLVEPLVPGDSYILSMEFEGYLNDRLLGFYRSSYTNQNGETVYLGTTQMQPTDARRAFPCFDEPAFKVEFEIEIIHDGKLEAISNMPLKSHIEDPNQPGWFIDDFERSLPMSTYLVAFIVSDFVQINRTTDDGLILFRVWTRESAIDQASYALEHGPDVLSWFEEYYQIPFPLPKQDMAALPDFDAGAMENWGLITYRETALLYDQDQSSAYNAQRVTVVIAHELAHMWFGDLVTMEWWTDLWLNEGFASYMEFLGTNSVQPSFQMFDQFTIENTFYAFGIDAKENSTHAISIEVEDPIEIGEIFDGISYSKGACVIRMMRYFLTEGTFRQGLTNYITEHSYGNANQDDLWRAMTAQAVRDGTLGVSVNVGVKGIMDTWTLHEGFPVVNVTIIGDGTAILKQERFLLVKNENSNPNNTMWWIPLTWTDSVELDFDKQGPDVTWMSVDEDIKAVSGLSTSADWIVFNVEQAGYYRVNYNLDNWQNLFDQLEDDHTVFSNNTRAQLLDDAMNLARAVPSLLDYDFALPVNNYLVNETGYAPFVAAMDNLEYLEEMFTAEVDYDSLKNYMLSLITPLYENVTFTDSVYDDHIVQRTRSLAVSWACHLEEAECITDSTEIFATWMADSSVNPISPNLKSSVYCTGVAEGGQTEWDFEYEQYLVANLGTEVDYLLAGMGCSKDQAILQNYLDLTLLTPNSPVRKQDAYKVWRSVANNDDGNTLSWNYLNANWDAIVAYVGYSEAALYLAYSADEFNTQAELDELVAFRDAKAGELGSYVANVDETIEVVQNNVIWTNLYYGTIAQWLKDNGYGNS